MVCDCSYAVAFFQPVGHCKWNRNPNNKHEEWLDKVPEMQSMPFMMAELDTKKVDYSIV